MKPATITYTDGRTLPNMFAAVAGSGDVVVFGA
jgi:hypothetical protein